MMLRCVSFLAAALSVSAFSPALNTKSPTTPQALSSPLFRNERSSLTEQFAMPETFTELPEKVYTPKTKETPKVLGGLKIGLRKLVVITGASSGLGLWTAKSLLDKGDYFLVLAVRDPEKMKKGKT